MKEFKIEEKIRIISRTNCKVTMTEKDGFRIILFEPKVELALKSGRWVVDGDSVVLCLDAMENNNTYFKAIGFFCGKWYGEDVAQKWEKNHDWKKADIREVELLMSYEADNRGIKEGVKIISPSSGNEHTLTKGVFSLGLNGLYHNDICVFNSKNGKWAEVVEEKIPYQNCYDTEIFDGDKYWFISELHRANESIHPFNSTELHSRNSTNSLIVPFVGTEKECYRWLYDNYDNFNK